MSTFRTLTFALASAAMAAAGVDSWQRSTADVPHPAVQAGRPHEARAGADTAYLPDLFVEAERAAPIEPMPPQF